VGKPEPKIPTQDPKEAQAAQTDPYPQDKVKPQVDPTSTAETEVVEVTPAATKTTDESTSQDTTTTD
jgi:hypothetical protein